MQISSGQSSLARRSGRATVLRQRALALLAALALPCAATAQNVQFLPNSNVVAGVTLGNTFTTYTGEGGPATAATFPGAPLDAVADAFGNIYIADTTANAIRRVDAVTGIITTVAGGATSVCAAANTDKTAAGVVVGDNCPATQAILNAPNGLRIFKGNLYIADASDNFIRRVDGITGIITAYAGNGTATVAAAGVLATATSMRAPTDVIFDPAGNGYVVTSGGNPAILRIDAVTQLVSFIAGTGTAGNTGDNGTATTALIKTAVGIALDPQGNIYFSESAQNDIRKVTIATGNISTYVGTSGGGPAAFADGPANTAELNSPQHIAIDALGNLYIADQTNHRIRMVTPPAGAATYGIVSTIVGNGTAANSASGTLAVNSKVNNPRSVDILPSGDLLLADGFNRQEKIIALPVNFPATAVGATATLNASAQVDTALTLGTFAVPLTYPSFVSGAITNCTAGSPVAAATICTVGLTFQPNAAGQLGAPLQFIDSNNNTYTLPLAGTGNAPAATLLPGIVNPIAGTGTPGNSGDTAAATAARLNNPTAIAVDAAGNTFFTDTTNNEVREITPAGIISRVAGTGTASFSGDGVPATAATLNAPSGLALDAAGNLYIADTGNNRIRVVANGIINTLAGNGTAAYTGDSGPAAAATLSAPQGLFYRPNGVLYVADTGNNALRIIGIRSTLINTIAGTGIAGSLGDGGFSVNAQLAAPTAVVVDASGNIDIADSANNRIRRIASNGIISTYAGNGVAGFIDGSSSAAELNAPNALAVDPSGTLYIASAANNAIRRVANGQVTTVAGTGTAGSTGNSGLSTAATFHAPRGVALDNSGNLVIADSANNLIRNITTAATQLAFANASPGTTSAARTITLSNSGNLPLTIASLTIPSGFVEQPSGATDCNAAALVLTASAACQASIAFAPIAPQTYTGNIVVTDNAQNQPAAAQTIAVSGTGAYVFVAKITGPSTTVSNVAQTFTVTVTKPTATYFGTLHFTSSDPKSVLPADYTFTTADNGAHAFSLKLLTAGIQSVAVTDTTDPTVTSTALVTVTGGPPASLVILSGNNQSVNINGSFTQPLSVQAFDAAGNPSSSAAITFTAPSTGADVTFNNSATYTAPTNSGGVLTTPQMIADGVTGTFNVIASATGAPSVTFTLTNTSTVPASFTLTANPPSINSLPPGTSGSTLVTITPVGGFNSPVTITCTDLVPSTTCTANPSTAPASGTGATTSFTLTISTTGPATNARLTTTHSALYTCLLLLPVAFISRRKKLRNLALTLIAGALFLTLGGCGSTSTNGLVHNQTPAGTYSVTVTGTSGSLSTTLPIAFYVAGAP